MNHSMLSKRTRDRRLSEIRAGHCLLKTIFCDSDLPSEEVEKALRFAKRETAAEVVPAACAMRKLARWYSAENPDVACRIIDAGAISGGMLWLQSALNRIVRDLANGRPAILMVTGLRELVRSPGKRWSGKAEREREETVRLLEEQVERWSARTGTPVSFLVA